MKNKKKLIIPIICGGIVATVITAVMVVLVAGFPWLIIYLGSMFGEDPPEPAITYGEFPFELVYEINGERTTIRDVYVCEYVGVGWDAGRGSYRKWNGYVKGTGLENVLICEDVDRKVFCQVGHPLYYMGYAEQLSWENKTLEPPHLYTVEKNSTADYLTLDEIKTVYNIDVLAWEFSDPIQNG